MPSFLENILEATASNTPKELYCLHSLTLDDLLTVSHEGALACPSIAVTDNKSDYDKFGSITFVMKGGVLLKGKNKTYQADSVSQIFSRDAYTIRAPEETLVLNVNAANELKNRLKSASDTFEHQAERMGLDRKEVSWRHLYQEMKASDASKLLFLEKKGITPDVPKKTSEIDKRSLLASGVDLLGEDGFKALLKKLDSLKFSEQDFSILREINDEFSNRIEQSGTSIGRRRAERIKKMSDEDLFSKVTHTIQALTKYTSSVPTIDKSKYSLTINELITTNYQSEYILWVDEELQKTRKETVYTTKNERFESLSEAINYMLERSGKGKEESLNYSSKDLMGMRAERFLSIEEVINNSNLIDSEVEFDEDSPFDAAFREFTDLVEPHRFGNSEQTRATLKKITHLVCVNEKPNFDSAYNKSKCSEIGVSREQFKSAAQNLRKEYLSTPSVVPYFEAVEYRDVPLIKNNIETVMVPKHLTDTVIELFDRYGIELDVTSFDPKIKLDQVSKIPVSSSLNKHYEKLEEEKKAKVARKHLVKC
ncbi:hypothetical protein [Vibrio crassostreae]|uniref:hypothetical protein n=1 Tax=Vibrio crassostreae TaxID=246167 RepID=UPI001FEF0B4C|nr:hypothetical protein [Vibrio crassostreae]